MKFNIRALALASAILWGGCVLLVGVANLICASYGQHFLEMLSSFYPGYHATRSFAEAGKQAIPQGFCRASSRLQRFPPRVGTRNERAVGLRRFEFFPVVGENLPQSRTLNLPVRVAAAIARILPNIAA